MLVPVLMTPAQIVIGVILLIAAVFLIVAVLMQNGKSHGLSGAIAGGAETFFGKQKGSTIERRLSKITTVVAIIFVVLVLVVCIMQPQTDFSEHDDDYTTQTAAGSDTGDAGTDAVTGEDAGTEAPADTEAPAADADTEAPAAE